MWETDACQFGAPEFKATLLTTRVWWARAGGPNDGWLDQSTPLECEARFLMQDECQQVIMQSSRVDGRDND